MKYAPQNRIAEWTYLSGKTYRDPFNEAELEVVFTDPEGNEMRVPSFWTGGQTWRVRYASPKVGTHRYRTVCSDASNADLHGQTGVLEVTPYEGKNPLLMHGPLQVAQSGRHLEHKDGTPFFWLADTWWMGLCHRLGWPGDFQALTADRVAKEFSVIQIVAGLYPDMPPFDERGANEAGFPWDPDYASINPAYFDMADLRIHWLVRSGLAPCIVGCWGYFLPWMGVDKMRQHWRYLVARYGAYPVVWCLAGEYDMPYYLSDSKDRDREWQRSGWKELCAFVRQLDPYHRPITIHPGSFARDVPGFPELLDLDMLQTGHSDASIGNTVSRVRQSYHAEPTMPVVDGEVAYEGIGGQCREQIQRLMFWACVLNGTAGHTYGANGIWQANTMEEPFGPSPHGMNWGTTPWEEAHRLPGSYQLGLARRLLDQYQWHLFEPHPEWIEARVSEENQAKHYHPYIAGIPGQVRIAYLPFSYSAFTITGLEDGVAYRAFLFNPANGERASCGDVKADDGRWTWPALKEDGTPQSRLPVFQDWVLVMETDTARK